MLELTSELDNYKQLYTDLDKEYIIQEAKSIEL